MPDLISSVQFDSGTPFSDQLSEFRQSLDWEIFEQQLDDTLERLQTLIGSSVNLLRQSKGKRLRPLLVFAGCSLFTAPNSSTLKAALASELIHMASLIHDDIIDNSTMRRGKPSANSLYGNHSSVLLGDALFAESFKILASPDLLSSMRHFIRAVQEMCAGEIQQGLFQYDTNRTVSTYLNHISLKTGALIEASCQAGGETAQADKYYIKSLLEFGNSLGQAFQIADDILDFSSQENFLGKPVLNDLRQGNYTLPVLYLFEDKTYGNWLKNILQEANWQPETVYQIQQALYKSGALLKSTALVKAYLEKAGTCLEEFPYSPAREFLSEICKEILLKLPGLPENS